MSLPEWIEEQPIDLEGPDKLVRALKIAWEALTDIEINGSGSGHWKDDGHCGSCMSEKAVKAMRQIEELGK